MHSAFLTILNKVKEANIKKPLESSRGFVTECRLTLYPMASQRVHGRTELSINEPQTQRGGS